MKAKYLIIFSFRYFIMSWQKNICLKKNVKLSIKKLEADPWATVANEFKVGDEVDGVVTKVLPYGAFVEIKPGVEGLVHISDFSWTKKKVNVAEYVKEGEKVKVRITDLHPEDRKLKLGIKQLVANPWETAEKDFAVGTVIKGKVVEVKPFGIFVEIADGIDAFVHSSDYSWVGEETPKLSNDFFNIFFNCSKLFVSFKEVEDIFDIISNNIDK